MAETTPTMRAVPHSSGRPRVVASYTTLPDRYELLYESILSVKDHVDEVYVALPYVAKRLQTKYPDLPEKFANICTVVRLPEDYGPICKIYGALLRETDPTTMIISCDDDINYPPDIIPTLVRHANENPSDCITGTGALVKHGLLFISIHSTASNVQLLNHFIGINVDPVKGRPLDVAFGVAGILYRRGFFPLREEDIYTEMTKYAVADMAIFCNDDILISAYLNKKGITRRTFKDIPLIKFKDDVPDALSSSMLTKMIPRSCRAYRNLQAEGFFSETEELDLNETIAFKIILLIAIVVLIILIVCIYLWHRYR